MNARAEAALRAAFRGLPGCATALDLATGKPLAHWRPDLVKSWAAAPGSVLKPLVLATLDPLDAALPCARPPSSNASARLHPRPQTAPLNAARSPRPELNSWSLRPARRPARLANRPPPRRRRILRARHPRRPPTPRPRRARHPRHPRLARPRLPALAPQRHRTHPRGPCPRRRRRHRPRRAARAGRQNRHLSRSFLVRRLRPADAPCSRSARRRRRRRCRSARRENL